MAHNSFLTVGRGCGNLVLEFHVQRRDGASVALERREGKNCVQELECLRIGKRCVSLEGLVASSEGRGPDS